MNAREHRLPVHRRLAVHLGLAIAAVTVVNFSVSSLYVVTRERDTLTRELTRRLVAESHSLAAAMTGPLLRHDPELELHPLILRALDQTPDWMDLVVVNAAGEIEGHRDLQRVGEQFAPPPALRPIETTGPAESGLRVGLDGNDIVVLQPITRLDQNVGLLVARASRAGIEKTLAASQRRLIAIGVLGALVGTVAALFLVGWHLRPLGELHRGVAKLGSGDLTARVNLRSRTELGAFGTLINSMADGLESAQQRLIHKERLDKELEIAGELQTILLPRSVDVGTGYAVRAHYAPALEVSGDYYDVIPLGGEQYAVVAADVSGKGVPGLVVMSMLRTTLHALTRRGEALTEVLAAAEDVLRSSMRRGMFVTCVYGVLDARNHVFRYVSAGHCPPARFGPKGADWLPAGGKPLGLFPPPFLRKSLVEREVRLAPGEGLVLYTDGLVEVMNDHGDMNGHEVVLEVLRKGKTQDAGQVLANLVQHCTQYRGGTPVSDDITLLVLRRDPVPAVRPAEVTA